MTTSTIHAEWGIHSVNGFNHSILSITQESAHTCAPNLGHRRVQSVPTITILTVLIFDRLNKTLLLGQK